MMEVVNKHTVPAVGKVLIVSLVMVFWTLPVLSQASQDLRMTPVVKAVERVSPAVVNIQASKVVEREINPFPGLDMPDFGPFFRDFFPRSRQKFLQRSLGSGVIIDGHRRLVLTNAHVITGASDIKVQLLDGRKFVADLIGADPDFDLALLRIGGQGTLPQVELGSSKDLLMGEPVIAIGNPYGFSHTVTTGVVSALNRTIQTEHGTYMGFIQTDAAINPGNSGGPLLNIYGQLIGINTAIFAQAQGIGFAIPVDKAKRVMAELVSYGHVQPVWLGLAGQNVDQNIVRYLGLKRVEGLLVTEIYPGTPAKSSGLVAGDVILKYDSNPIADKEDYLDLLRHTTKGEEVRLGVWHRGRLKEFVLRAMPFSESRALKLARQRWGLEVKGTKGQGVVVTRVLPNTPASSLGLRAGDRLYKIAGVGLVSPADFARAFMRFRMQNTLLLLVARGNRGYYVRMRM